MPSFVRIKRVSVIGVAFAAFTIPVATASAGDVWLWACHGPGGQALPNLGTKADPGAGGSCQVDNGADSDALHLNAASGLTRSFQVPSQVTLGAIDLGRTTALTAGQTYTASTTTPTTVFETLDGAAAPLTGSKTADASGTQFDLAVKGAGAGGVDVSHIAMKVTDAKAPTGAVGGWRSPASDLVDKAHPEDPAALRLNVQASDVGVGLKSATAYLDGVAVASGNFGDASCVELSSDSAQIDLPYGAVGQNDNVDTGAPVGCLNRGELTLLVKTAAVADGPNHTITVTATDWAGNTTKLMDNVKTEVLNHVDLGKSSQELSIGTSGTTTPNANANNNSGGSNSAAGNAAQVCRSPRLSISLAQKPMRISNGQPVLQYGKRYRFNGRLTCVTNGKRKSAPKRARVDITNKIGKKTYEKAGTTVRDKGRLTVILAYKTSRTITFRFTSAGGQRSTVSIKVKVAKKKSTRR
jgi:hypothetical protein